MTMPDPAPLPILFLKTRSHPTDAYSAYFAAHPSTAPFTPHFVPVLQHTHRNLPTLTTFLSTPAALASISAIIITSQRAAEALGAVLPALPAATAAAIVAHTQVYVVGPTTQAAVLALGFPAAHVRGAEAGNGAALSEVILRDRPAPATARMLFLVGETRRDIIPRKLKGSGVELVEMVVYETITRKGFGGEFRAAVEEVDHGDGRGGWVVVFSPQGAAEAVEALKGRAGWRVAAIGPTTEEALGRQPDVVARRPSAEGLWEAVDAGMRKSMGS
ncbi:tetrapyrrole biosynthesis, uroporphyrinogen III synthase [Geopyxis carbonaria]|nr:tetrapyrrole biosynthesis, uroporphyrinogen III synthase [Geopyxis carbonaria]